MRLPDSKIHSIKNSKQDYKKYSEKIRPIDSVWTFLVALAFLGPLALPLLWRNPRFRLKQGNGLSAPSQHTSNTKLNLMSPQTQNS